MPKVHTPVARKDYPNEGIQKGQRYYTWSLKTGPRSSRTFRSLNPPLPEQLTTSEYLQQWYPLNREIGSFDGSPDDLQALIDQVGELREEAQESADNIPSQLQDGPVGELLQERMDECEDWPAGWRMPTRTTMTSPIARRRRRGGERHR